MLDTTSSGEIQARPRGRGAVLLGAARRAVSAHPLLAACIAGALARAVAATAGLGFHARDDYFHVLEPALRWLEDPGFDWDASDLPGAGIRSHLLPRAVWLMMRGLGGLGVHEPDTVLRLVYLAMGLYSLLAVPGMYLAARRLLDERGARLATWLAALHFAMVYSGTRLLIEALAMPPLLFGLWLATYPSFRRQLGAGVLVGLACWFRFQVGVAAIGLAVAVGLAGREQGGLAAAARRVGGLAAGGALAVLGQGLFDLWTTGRFLGPVIRNILVNLDPPSALSRSNPFAYLGIWLLLTVPPATVVLLPAMVRAGARLRLVAWPFLVFLLVHSAVPHKEERFMIPVLPLFLLLVAAAPAALQSASGRGWARLRRWWPASRGWLVALHLLALAVAATSQSQANLRDSMLVLRHDPRLRAVVSMGPEVQAYFLGRPEVPIARSGTVDAVWLRRTVRDLEAEGAHPNRFLGFAQDRARMGMLLAAMGFRCDTPLRIEGWWLDRLVYTLNPRRNRRRSPVLVWSCEQAAPAPPQPAAAAG